MAGTLPSEELVGSFVQSHLASITAFDIVIEQQTGDDAR